MKVLIVSGFLGAGKTTFIKELIRRTQKKIVILENEYGDTDLDSRELKQAGDLEIMDFIEGCICCSKKDSFSNTLLAIHASLEPEYLIVEPTGVGKLSNIISNVNKIVYDRIQLLDPIVILSPAHIDWYLNSSKEIYTDQITNAKHIIFSKIESQEDEIIENAVQKIRALNQTATITKTHYKDSATEWFCSLLENPNEKSNSKTNSAKNFGTANLDDANIGDKNALSTSASKDVQNIFAKQINQFTLKEGKLTNITELIFLLEDILHGSFGNIFRAKGVLQIGGDWIRYDLADLMYGIIKDENAKNDTQNIFIGYSINQEKIQNRFGIKNNKKFAAIKRRAILAN